MNSKFGKISLLIHIIFGIAAFVIISLTTWKFAYFFGILIISTTVLVILKKKKARPRVMSTVLLISGLAYLVVMILSSYSYVLFMEKQETLNSVEQKLCSPGITFTEIYVKRLQISDGEVLYRRFTGSQFVTDTSTFNYYNQGGEKLCSYNGFAGDLNGCEDSIIKDYSESNIKDQSSWKIICSNFEAAAIY